MQCLRKDLGVEKRPELKLQACMRGWLERCRLRRAREAAEVAASKKLEQKPEEPCVSPKPRKPPPARKMSFMHVQGRRGTVLHHSPRGRRASEIVSHCSMASVSTTSTSSNVPSDLSLGAACEGDVEEPMLSLF